jgi:hypothetical protein
MARFLADEDFPLPVVLHLRAYGHDVTTALEEGLANRRTEDNALLSYSSQTGRAVLTHNRKDYVRLHRDHPAHAGIIVCTRDADSERLARHIHDAAGAVASLRSLLVRITQAGFSHSPPDPALLVAHLNQVWRFDADSRFDVEWLTNQTFRLVEVAPDLTVRRRITGYQNSSGGIVSAREPNLLDTLVQAAVFAQVVEDFSRKVLEAQARGDREFQLLRDGDYPDLLGPLAGRSSIAGSVRPGMLEVWQALEDMLVRHGYRATLSQQAGAEWEIRAQRLNR